MTTFKNPGAFAKFLQNKAAGLPTVQTRALSKAAAIVQSDAKARIGHYQAEAGPFPAWDPLTDATIADKQRQGYGVPDPLLRTGQMRESIDVSVSPDGFVVGSRDPIALYQELGTHGPNPAPDGYHVPPRPFLGPALYENQEQVVAAVTTEIVGFLADRKG